MITSWIMKASSTSLMAYGSFAFEGELAVGSNRSTNPFTPKGEKFSGMRACALNKRAVSFRSLKVPPVQFGR